MLQDGSDLRQGNTRKPLEELMNRGILLKVFKQCGDGHPRAEKHPGTAYAIRVALNVGTGGPVDHERMVALRLDKRNRPE